MEVKYRIRKLGEAWVSHDAETVTQTTMRCAVCHAAATHAEMQDTPMAIISRDGRVSRGSSSMKRYYCVNHTGMT